MARRWLAALLGVSLLTACGQQPATPPGPATSTATSQEHVLELEATGTAVLTLTFTLDGKTSEETDVRLPWRKTVRVAHGAGRHEWKLVMRHSGGTLSATGSVNGKLVTRTGGTGSPGSNNTSTLSGSFSD